MAPETLRMMGSMSDQKVLILVDGGSTHNFIEERLVTMLGLHAQSTPLLRVMIGNGIEIECLHI